MVSVSLRSLDHMPYLPKLRVLNLMDNYIRNGLERIVYACPNLRELILQDNTIFLLCSLQPLTNLTMLEDLELYGCPVRANPRYQIQRESWFPNTYFTPGFADSESDSNSSIEGGETMEDSDSSWGNSDVVFSTTDEAEEDGDDDGSDDSDDLLVF